MCWSWILAAFINFLVHVWVCTTYNFTYKSPDNIAWKSYQRIILQLLPCILSVGIGEISFWIDSAFASYLESGTISLLRCAYQLINIPLGVIVTSLSIVLLPYFSRIGHSKEELGVYLSEAIKFITWMIIPVTFVMIFCSREIFETMFFSNKFTMDHVVRAQWNINAYLVGLIFFALEKILLNAFYALQSTWIATAVALVTIVMNFFMNRILMGFYGGMGLALATSIAAAVRILIFILILIYHFNINFHGSTLWKLFKNYMIQLFILGTLFTSAAMLISRLFENLLLCYSFTYGPIHLVIDSHFFLHSFGYWLWFGPLVGILFLGIYRTRKFFGVSFSYLD
jgi:murein biosynthesis integral membrane protein MurJ